MSTLEGQSIGKYKLLERLGRGGMADVYKAHHPKLDRTVAVKILHSYLAEGEDFLARFEREARSVAALRHPHILQIFDFDVENDLYYMVMEYADGGTLQERMISMSDQGKHLPVRHAVTILHQVAEALDYAHEKGLIHRDIKPSNILLDSSGNAFLADFGIARLMSGATQFTATGGLIGTPIYMSPEQGRGDELTCASDNYSLGVIMYQLITGRVPFSSDTTPLAIIHKHINENPPDPGIFRPGLPPAAKQVILKALAKFPQERYQTAGEMVRELEKSLPSRVMKSLDASSAKDMTIATEMATIVSAGSPETAKSVPPSGQLPETKPSLASLTTERIEKTQVDSRSLPTVSFAEETREVFFPSPPEKIPIPVAAPTAPETVLRAGISPAPPVTTGVKHRTQWLILVLGLILFTGRFLVEFLVVATNLFDYLPVLLVVELAVGVLGLFVGAWHWLALRLFHVPVSWKTLFILPAIWCASFLTIGATTTLIDIETPFAWHTAFGLAGLLGGLGTALLVSRMIPHHRLGRVLAWTGLSGLWFYGSYLLITLSEPLWSQSESFLKIPLHMSLPDFLVGTFLAWMIALLVRGEAEPVPQTTRRFEYALLTLVLGWMATRLASEFIGAAIFGELVMDIHSPAWRTREIFSLALTGLVSGILLWVILVWLKVKTRRFTPYLLPIAWALAYLLGLLLPLLFPSENTWFWALSKGIFSALAGAFTAWLILPGERAWRWRQVLWVALGFGIGSIFGNLAFSSAWNGLGAFKTGVNFHLCVTLQSGGTALLGGVLLFAWLLEYRYKFRWLALFVAALGFALGVLFQDLLVLNLPESTGVRWWGFLPYALWGARW